MEDVLLRNNCPVFRGLEATVQGSGNLTVISGKKIDFLVSVVILVNSVVKFP